MSLPVFSPMRDFGRSSPEANDLTESTLPTFGRYPSKHVNSHPVTQCWMSNLNCRQVFPFSLLLKALYVRDHHAVAIDHSRLAFLDRRGCPSPPSKRQRLKA